MQGKLQISNSYAEVQREGVSFNVWKTPHCTGIEPESMSLTLVRPQLRLVPAWASEIGVPIVGLPTNWYALESADMIPLRILAVILILTLVSTGMALSVPCTPYIVSVEKLWGCGRVSQSRN